MSAVSDEILGYGPIEPFLRDSEVSEVMVNGPNSIYVERSGRLSPVEAHFTSEAHLRRQLAAQRLRPIRQARHIVADVHDPSRTR